MSLFRLLTIATGAVMGASAAALAGPDLGQDATPEEIAAWDISIAPDGATLPPGGGSAQEGAAIYESSCLSCHGEDGAGGEGLADPLVGGIGSLGSGKPVKTVGSYWPHPTTLFDYVRRAMPYGAPMSLTNDEVYAVSAYILALNGVIRETDRMDAETLPAVQMPNRDGFISHWPEP